MMKFEYQDRHTIQNVTICFNYLLTAVCLSKNIFFSKKNGLYKNAALLKTMT